MTTITFDTDRLVEDLQSSGLPHEQARAIVRGIVESQSQLAIKRDLTELENNIRHEIRELENRIVIKTGAMIAVSIGITAALVKLL